MVRNRRLVNLLGQRREAMVRGKSGRYQVSNPGKRCWRVRDESEDNLAKSEWSEAAYILAFGDGEQVRAAGESC